MTTLREAAQAVMDQLAHSWVAESDPVAQDLKAALAQEQAEPVQEPWSTRERFYEAIDRAVEAVRQEMKVKTVTMLLPEYDITLPIIDARSGHVLVGPVVPAPPQRKPLTEAQIYAAIKGIDSLKAVEVARAIERAHGIE